MLSFLLEHNRISCTNQIDYMEFQASSSRGAGSGAGGPVGLAVNGEFIAVPASGVTVHQDMVRQKFVSVQL